MQRKFKHLFAGVIVLLLVVAGKSLLAQGASDLKFNEILVHNESNFIDEYGQRSGWIEIVNSSYSKVNIGGCFLTDDKNNPKKYWIATNSPETLIQPRGFVLFFADNQPSRGVFHMNFELTEGKTIYLFDANGKSVLDELQIPTGQKPNVSYARISIDSNEWALHEQTTPRSDNDHSRHATAGEKFVQHDPAGVGMVVVAMSVVFLALAILFLVYLAIGKLFTKKKKTVPSSEAKEEDEGMQLSGEINAAITMALHLHLEEQHDYEDTVLTIKKVARSYSPWSSKIYTLRKNPRI
ncbi:OadG family transporter subunit [Mangrovibacterium lignilyticum]|uniref:OadG family transporter subunit n=1 Tax=Mangrovibacterium lignilyticum TaxID=2668052 RepID=UPI0013D85690|nr:OadG family transporter subunit [Mangrovibacterium lignilyticum]